MSAPTIPDWASLDADQRADAVIIWCMTQGIDTSSILDYQLAAAMEEANKTVAEAGIPFDPAPMDYVHMIRVLAAFLRSRL